MGRVFFKKNALCGNRWNRIKDSGTLTFVLLFFDLHEETPSEKVPLDRLKVARVCKCDVYYVTTSGTNTSKNHENEGFPSIQKTGFGYQ